MAKELTSKQRRFLKQLSHHLNPMLQMGKEGASPQFIQQLLEQLERHELIKVRILNNCDWSKEAVQTTLTEADITLVQRIGHVLTVYRRSEENPELKLPR